MIRWQTHIEHDNHPHTFLSCIQVRINGEDPSKGFRPCPGTLGFVSFPNDMPGVRIDTWVETGTDVSPNYDSLLGKLMVFADTRALAIEKMQAALAATRLQVGWSKCTVC